MTPLEINKKIVEIKKPKNEIWVQVSDSNYIGHQNSSDIFNWAENISDAWELFEENQEVYLKKMHYTDGTIVYQCVFRDSNLNVLGDSKADTAPMAICLAWLVWKENK
jgi:hypothetical protein